MSKQEVPYRDRWYIRRLVAKGVIKENGDLWYLDAVRADEYMTERRVRAVVMLVVVLLLTLLYCAIFVP